MSKSTNASNQKGLTIIEAMMAVAVLMLGVMAAINIFPAALKLSRNAEQETVAANLAQTEIEQMFQLGYDNIPVGTIEAKHRLSADQANPFYNFQRQTISSYVDGNLNDSASATGLKKITVTMYWTTPNLGLEKSLPISVMISQR